MSDYRIESARDLLTSHVFRVEERTVVRGETRFTRDVVVHPGAVAVLAENDRGEVGVIRQYRSAVDRWLHEIPAGTRDRPGEPPRETAERELAEELGVTADHWEPLVEYFVSPGYTDQVMTVFFASGLHAGDRAPDGPEEITSEVLWLTPRELWRRAVHDGLDSPTALALSIRYGRLDD